jgi:hypothetical protein
MRHAEAEEGKQYRYGTVRPVLWVPVVAFRGIPLSVSTERTALSLSAAPL